LFEARLHGELPVEWAATTGATATVGSAGMVRRRRSGLGDRGSCTPSGIGMGAAQQHSRSIVVDGGGLWQYRQ